MPKHFVHEGATRWWGILDSNTSCHWFKFPSPAVVPDARVLPKTEDFWVLWAGARDVNLPTTPWPWHKSGERKFSPDMPIPPILAGCARNRDSWSFTHTAAYRLPFSEKFFRCCNSEEIIWFLLPLAESRISAFKSKYFGLFQLHACR